MEWNQDGATKIKLLFILQYNANILLPRFFMTVHSILSTIGKNLWLSINVSYLSYFGYI